MLDRAGGTLPLHPGSIVSIRTVCRPVWPRRGCALRLRCVETTRGKTMPKLLNELERKPCPLALAERDSREALRDRQSLTAAFFGDPLPGLSALDRREQRESLTRASLVV
jgi:hypothetical protein